MSGEMMFISLPRAIPGTHVEEDLEHSKERISDGSLVWYWFISWKEKKIRSKQAVMEEKYMV